MNGSNGVANGDSCNGASPSSHWPENVGIINMEIYFPAQYVDQAELEQFDGVSQGKYTIGLGQTKMGFCSDNEDVNSLCLTALSRLVKKSDISYKDIGRLEVGTETIVDKSKSVKSVLMKLFEGSGNSDVEGVDSTNACYGGTAALFNCVSWMESSSWDGRYAVVVCADIAVYAKGNARPTGGAGAVAMLIGPNAALILDRGLRASHVQHEYDFYKPNLSSEYPIVDGKLSITCYLAALDKCYRLYCDKAAAAKQKLRRSETIDLSTFDAMLFHTPFCKLVQKSLARLSLNDFVRSTDCRQKMVESNPALEAFRDVQLENTYMDKDVEKAFLGVSKDIFEAKTKPSLHMATNVGNMYTPSLYGGLISYLCSHDSVESLAGRRIGLFSYGSGLVSSFFSLHVSSDFSPMSPLAMLKRSISDVHHRLAARNKATPQQFDAVLALREEAVQREVPFNTSSDPQELFPGTWYLTSVDKMRRRNYAEHKVGVQNGH